MIIFLFILNLPVFVIAKRRRPIKTYLQQICVRCILLQLIWLHYPITWTDLALDCVSRTRRWNVFSISFAFASIMWFQHWVASHGVFNKFQPTQKIITPEYESQRHSHISMNSHTNTFELLLASSWLSFERVKAKMCVIESAFGSEIQNCNYPCDEHTSKIN